MSSQLDFAHVAPGAEGFTPDHPCAEHIPVVDADQGLVSWSRKKIAICGFASSTKHYIPIDSPEWTICALNQLYRHLPRVDLHFDIHGYWQEGNVDGTDHPRWLAECGIPVLMTKREAGLPTAVKYPVERLIEKHGVDYFTSTVAFMLAYALDLIDRAVEVQLKALPTETTTVWDAYQLARSIYREYTVGIFGIDLIVGTEYGVQKPCAEFWIGEIESRGILLLLPPETALLKQAYRYGYERPAEVGLIKLSEFESRLTQLEIRKQQAIAEIHTGNGAVQEATRIRDCAVPPTTDALTARIAELSLERDKRVALAQTMDGAQQETKHAHDVIELRARGGVIPFGG